MEYACIFVIYRDAVILYLCTPKRKFRENQKTTVVKDKRTDGKELSFSFDWITKDYTIKYKYNFF